MIAKTLISDGIVPLSSSDTTQQALDSLSYHHLQHLPVVEHGVLLGILSEDDLLQRKEEANGDIKDYAFSLHALPVALESDHLYEVLRLMSQFRLSSLPVVDAENNYLGLITQENLMHRLAEMSSFAEKGSVLVVKVGEHRNYNMSDLVRIVESEGAAVLSASVSSAPYVAAKEVTLKINRQEVRPIAAALERYGYTVQGFFAEPELMDALHERYDAFMNYLNV